MKKILFLLSVLLLICSCTNNSATNNENMKKAVHPKIFEMVECWISDTNYPVVTEVNLNSVYEDRNQFDYDNVKVDSEWISYKDNELFLRYKYINKNKNKYKILFQNKSGGSLTEASEIEYEIGNREIIVDDKSEMIESLKITSIKMIKQKE